MKKCSILLAVLLLAVDAFAQKPDCNRFRNGKFEMTYLGKKTIIIRKGNRQLQYFDGSKKPTEYAVKWIDGCTFTLTPQKDFVKKLKEVPLSAVLTEKITRTSPKSYTQFTSANFTKKTITSEIYKID